MVKTLPSRAEGVGSIPGREARSFHASWPTPKHKNRSSMVTRFNKDFKIKKK